jgi:hypothetical protein
MSRIGVNPSRFKASDYSPARVTVCVLTYVPHTAGYFRQRLEILRLCLSSLLASTDSAYDLLVFDNGSSQEAVDYLDGLQEGGQIQFLIRSGQNIGKIGAWQLMFHLAPGEVIAYSDDDIFYSPGWLEAGLEILGAFPRAGMVSGVPVRNAATYAVQAVDACLADTASGVTARRERRIPDEWEADWAASTGRDPAEHLKAFQDRQDLVLESQGVEAIAGANHFQFIAPKDLLLRCLPEGWPGRLMGHMVELDEAVDRTGSLRLSTTGRYTRHIGNQVSPDLAEEARRLGVMDGPKPSAQGGSAGWIARIPGGRRIALALYDRLFDVITEK